MSQWIEHPLIKRKTIESRIYQQVLAANVLKKGNTMIVAPTALGKTIIAALVSAERIKKYPESKILILAPSKPLVIQHEESFKNFLISKVTSLTGAINPKQRIERWEESQIICATPQTVESDIVAHRYSLDNVSLLVFDECHRGVGSYSYVFLASKYNSESKYPLILGLTASPGWDKEKIDEVCKNLYIEEIVVKTETDRDVAPYFNPVDIKWVKVDLTPELKEIKSNLEEALDDRLEILKKLGVFSSTSQISKKDVLQAKGKIQNRIASSVHPPQKCYMAVSILTAVINIQHALELLETQSLTTLDKYFVRLKNKKTKAAKSLMTDRKFKISMHLTKNALKQGLEHPKLDALIRLIKKEIKNPEARIMVFTQFRDTVENIFQKCKANNINAVKFYGQASRESDKGLTQKKQRKIINDFRAGKYQVLVSTSVAEEGIDIPSVDLVILYEPVPSEIRMIQRRGRTGRKTKGRMIILITKGTRDESYYWSSLHKEKKMKAQLSEDFNEFQTDLKNFVSSKEIKKKEEPREKPVIYVDTRESGSLVLRELNEMGVELRFKNLAIADFQISDEVIIERKTGKDFIGSILDKRLYKQAREMVESFNKPVIILEGEDIYSSSLHPNAVRGALASLAIDFGIPIIPTRSASETAAMIKRIAMREKKPKQEIPIRTERKPLTREEQQLYIIESLPSVGPVTARKLLEKFGSVKNVMNSTVEDMIQIEGIGKRTAEKIRNVIDSQYKVSDYENMRKMKLDHVGN